MTLSAEAKLKRFKVAEERKTGWNDTYRDALRYAAPQRDSFTSDIRGAARDGNSRVFDSTAMNAMQRFAGSLQTSLVPPFRKWLNLKAGRAIPAELKGEINSNLEDICRTMFTHIQMSNFDTQIVESFLDLAVGTGALLVQPGHGTKALSFTAVPLSQLYLEEGAFGEIRTVFRRHRMSVRTITETWPDAELTPSLERLLERKPDDEVEILESTIPHTFTKFNPLTELEETIDGFLYSVTFEKDKADLLIREQESSPWVVFRYSTFPGEVYGRGPLLNALPDIKTLNKTKELILKNASLAVAGAYTVADDGVININNVKIRPGALIPVASNAGGASGPTLAPLPRSGDFNVGQLIISDLQNAINEALFSDALGPVDLPTKSATEIAIRQQELAKRLGSTFGRLQFELLGPLVQRILFVLEEQGLIDLSRFKVDGNGIAIEPLSPLLQAQEQEELGNVLQYVEFLRDNLGINHPLVQQKAPAIAERIGDLMNVPESLKVSVADALQVQQQLAIARKITARRNRDNEGKE